MLITIDNDQGEVANVFNNNNHNNDYDKEMIVTVAGIIIKER